MIGESATCDIVAPAPMRSPSLSLKETPLSSGTRSRLTMCEGAANLVAFSFICTTRSVPPASGRAASPYSWSSEMASFRLVGAWYSNARKRPSLRMRSTFYNSHLPSAIKHRWTLGWLLAHFPFRLSHFRFIIRTVSGRGGKSDALLHQRRTARTGVPARREVAWHGGIDLAAD